MVARRLDQQVRHQVAVQRYARLLAREHDEELGLAYEAAQAVIHRVDLGAIEDEARLSLMLEVVVNAYAQRLAAARAKLKAALRNFVVEEAEFQGKLLDIAVNPEALWREVLAAPVNGYPLEQLFENFETDVLREIRRTLLEGWTNGESTDALVSRLD